MSALSLKNILFTYLKELPCVGFNSGKYDLNVVKSFLLAALAKRENNSIKSILKTGNTFKCITTDKLKFLDIKAYIAPGFSYSKYLKAYGVKETKGYFPYEYIDKIEKIYERELPPRKKILFIP